MAHLILVKNKLQEVGSPAIYFMGHGSRKNLSSIYQIFLIKSLQFRQKATLIERTINTNCTNWSFWAYYISNATYKKWNLNMLIYSGIQYTAVDTDIVGWHKHKFEHGEFLSIFAFFVTLGRWKLWHKQQRWRNWKQFSSAIENLSIDILMQQNVRIMWTNVILNKKTFFGIFRSPVLWKTEP